MVTYKCKKCNSEFKNYPSNERVFCSRECCDLSRRGSKLSKVHKEKIRVSSIGKNLGKIHSIEQNKQNSERMKGKKQSPETIRKRMIHAKGNKYRLGHHPTIESRLKMSEAKKGSKCHLWKDGITPINNQIRHSLEYRLWRKSCFERDNFTDQKTGQKGGRLQVHHINNFAEFSELRTSIENGITLSVESHKEFHKIYGKHNNTREQLEEFLIATVSK